MGKTAVVKARVEPALKRRAEAVLSRLGFDTSEAVRLFLGAVTREKAIPFLIRIPNAETRKAIADSRAGKGKTYRTAEEMDRALDL